MPAPNLLGRHRTTGEQIVACGTPTATHGINQHSTLDRLTPVPQKQNKTKQNNKQGTEKDTQQRRWGCIEHTREGARSCSPQEILVNKACKSSQQASPSTGERRR
jgi:hypothetical protein